MLSYYTKGSHSCWYNYSLFRYGVHEKMHMVNVM